MDLPTYTNIWRIEKRLYKLYDFRLPMPLPLGQITVFTAIAVPYVIILKVVGLPFSHTLLWLYILPPGALAWLITRPVLEGKRLPELVVSQVRYLAEPRTWCRMAPLAEKDEMVLVARVWRRAPGAAAVGARGTGALAVAEAVVVEAAGAEAAVGEPAVAEAAVGEPAVAEAAPAGTAVAVAPDAGAVAARERAVAVPEQRPEGAGAPATRGAPVTRGVSRVPAAREVPGAPATREVLEAPAAREVTEALEAAAAAEVPRPTLRRRRRDRASDAPATPPSPATTATTRAIPPAPASGQRAAAAAPPAEQGGSLAAEHVPASPRPTAGQAAPPPAPAAPASSPTKAAPPTPPVPPTKAPSPPKAPPGSRPVVTVTGDSSPERPIRMVERALGNPAGRRAVGWRDHVVVVPGGHRPGRPDQMQRDRARARLPVPGGCRIVVLGCTVGAGQTTTALLTGEVLASLRDDQVAALDLNPGPGSLSERARAVPPLAGNGAPEPSRLEVVTRESAAAPGDAEDPEEVTNVFELLSARYPLTLADPGATVVPRVLAAASQLVLVAPASQDAASALATTREWLEANGHGDLADAAIVVLNGVSRHTMPHVEQAEALARGRCRAIVRVPWDDRLKNHENHDSERPVSSQPAAPEASVAGPLSVAAVHAYTALAGVLVAAVASVPEQLRVRS